MSPYYMVGIKYQYLAIHFLPKKKKKRWYLNMVSLSCSFLFFIFMIRHANFGLYVNMMFSFFHIKLFTASIYEDHVPSWFYKPYNKFMTLVLNITWASQKMFGRGAYDFANLKNSNLTIRRVKTRNKNQTILSKLYSAGMRVL